MEQIDKYNSKELKRIIVKAIKEENFKIIPSNYGIRFSIKKIVKKEKENMEKLKNITKRKTVELNSINNKTKIITRRNNKVKAIFLSNEKNSLFLNNFDLDYLLEEKDYLKKQGIHAEYIISFIKENKTIFKLNRYLGAVDKGIILGKGIINKTGSIAIFSKELRIKYGEGFIEDLFSFKIYPCILELLADGKEIKYAINL